MTAEEKLKEQDKVKRAIDIVIEQHLEAFKELERIDREGKPNS